jgi:hypothetical protein
MKPSAAPIPIPIFAPVLSWLLLLEPLLELLAVSEEDIWVVVGPICDAPESALEDVKAEPVATEALLPDVIEEMEAVTEEPVLSVADAAPGVTCA